MRTIHEATITAPRGSMHLMRVDGRYEVHRIPAGNELVDHSPRDCACGAALSVRSFPRLGLVTAHDHKLLGAVPAAFAR